MRNQTALTLCITLLCLIATITITNPEPTNAQETTRTKQENQNTIKLLPNPINNVTHLNVTIQTPQNKIYNQNNITLNFTINSNTIPKPLWPFKLFGLYLLQGVAIDYEQNELMTIVETNIPAMPFDAAITYSKLGEDTYEGNAVLENLSQGPHNVTVWSRAESSFISWGYKAGLAYTTVFFTIDTIPPCISVLNGPNTTYTTSDIAIEFTTDKPLTTTTYSLDNTENLPAEGNFTLVKVPNGNHTLTVYATDEAGNTSTQMFEFTVKKPLIDFSSGVAVMVVIVVVVVGVGLLVVWLVVLWRTSKKHNSTGSFTAQTIA